MAPSNNIDALLKEILASMNLGKKNAAGRQGSGGTPGSQSGNSSSLDNLPISPAQALVIIGILGSALAVDSVLVSRNQRVEIVLVGSLKQLQKTQTEKLWDQLGALPFDEVIRAIVSRLI